MKTFLSKYKNRTVVDLKSLVIGDKVEICYCDTGAICVWSFIVEVKKNKNGKLYFSDMILDTKCEPSWLISKFEEDGCYIYIQKPFKIYHDSKLWEKLEKDKKSP